MASYEVIIEGLRMRTVGCFRYSNTQQDSQYTEFEGRQLSTRDTIVVDTVKTRLVAILLTAPIYCTCR
jgi:hypothetical protein